MYRKNPQKHFLSVIVPVYKQEAIIIRNLKQLIKVLNQIRYNYEIVVVIDGIVDKAVLKLKKAKLKKVRVLAYAQNKGKGFAIRLGMSQAVGDYVVFIDSGLEIDPNGISMLLEHMEWYRADIIVGSKRHPASLIKYNWQRKILSLGYYYLVKLIFRVKVRDTQAGIKIYKKNVLKKILPRLVEKNFAGDLEMLVVARILGYHRIYEAPIKLNYNFAGLSTAATWRSIYGILIDTLAIFYRKNILRYYSKPHNRMIYPEKIDIFSH